jgi:fructose-bisphosphate aldolase class II
VRKVNIDTDLRLASTGAIRQFMAKNPAEFDPRKYLKETITAMKAVCKERYEAFGSAGNADKIKVLSLEAMSALYEKGALKAQTK